MLKSRATRCELVSAIFAPFGSGNAHDAAQEPRDVFTQLGRFQYESVFAQARNGSREFIGVGDGKFEQVGSLPVATDGLWETIERNLTARWFCRRACAAHWRGPRRPGCGHSDSQEP